jgi:hypothetical protein
LVLFAEHKNEPDHDARRPDDVRRTRRWRRRRRRRRSRGVGWEEEEERVGEDAQKDDQ